MSKTTNSLRNVKMNRKDTLLQKVYDGTISLKDLRQMENIDMNQCEFPIRVLQKVYNPVSLVGPTTTVVGNIINIDVDDPQGFEEFKDALLLLNDEGTHTPYGESIWKIGKNVFCGYKFYNHKFYVYYQVTNAEMAEIERKIKGMRRSEMTVEDAKQLQKDLDSVLRGWQESSIDVHKDEKKSFSYDFRHFFKKVDVVSNYCKTHADKIEMNTKEMFKDHKKVDSKEFKITLPSDNPLGDDVVCKDLIGKVTEEIRKAAETFFNGDLKDIYAMSNMDAFLPFVGYAQANPELALFIKDIYQICYNAIGKETIDKEQYALLRNVVYSKALDLGVEFQDVVKVAIDCAMVSVKETKEGIEVTNSDVNRFKLYPIVNMFGKEFKVAMTNQPYMETIATEDDFLIFDRFIKDNEEIEFVNGKSTDDKLVMINDFTGTAVECNGVLVAEANVYAFEEVKAMVVFKTFDVKATPKQPMYDKTGALLDSLIEENNFAGMRVTGKNNNGLRNNSNLIGVFRSTCAFVKDEIVEPTDIIAYDPKPASQKLFLVVCK